MPEEDPARQSRAGRKASTGGTPARDEGYAQRGGSVAGGRPDGARARRERRRRIIRHVSTDKRPPDGLCMIWKHRRKGAVRVWDRLTADPAKREAACWASLEQVAQSHRQCEETGLSRDIARPQDLLTGARLHMFLNRYRSIVPIVRRLFAETAEHLPDQRILFILTDGSARIVEIHAPQKIVRRCEERGVLPGASLAEQSAGTNAVALALRLGEPVALGGEQHWCKLFRDWFCAAAPVVRPDRNPVACVDVSSCHDAGLGEKLALARLLAEHLREPMLAHQQAGRLTIRQLKILRLRAAGCANKEIAALLGVREDTVEEHVRAALRKLEARSVEQAIARLAKAGFI